MNKNRRYMQRLSVGLVSLLAAGASIVMPSSPASAMVTGLTGRAYGVFAPNITLFGGVQPPYGPAPVATLPPAGAASPVMASDASENVSYGPATFFESGPVTVKTAGTPAGGTVTSSTAIQPATLPAGICPGTSTSCVYGGPFTADSVASSCTAAGTGNTGSTTFANGLLVTATDANGTPTVTVPIPNSPPANDMISGSLIVNGSTETFTYTFNEQTLNPDGTFIVSAYHQHLFGPTAKGDIYVGRAVCGLTHHPVADFAGVGKTSVSVFRPSTGSWFINGGSTVMWGASGDIAVPSDYDGDGKADVAVFRPSTGIWYIHASTAGDTTIAFGAAGDIPVPGDYLGTGKSQVAVFRPSTGVWYINGGPVLSWGASGDIAVPGDYLGSGTLQIAVFRPSTGAWYINGGPVLSWGASGDIPVPSDYLGTGKSQIAVYRPSTGTWYVNGGPIVGWGGSGDIPVPGDYLGTGKSQIAVYRRSTGTWYVNGGPIVGWGASGDVPLPAPAANIMTFFP